MFDDYTDYEEIAERLPKGSLVSVRPDFGTAEPVRGKVEGHDEKGGRALIDYSFHQDAEGAGQAGLRGRQHRPDLSSLGRCSPS